MDIAAFVQNLTEEKRRIATGSASVIAGLAILITYFQSGPNAASYAKAEDAFSNWSASPVDDQLYKSMRQAIAASPSLEKRYEPAIAQKLMDMDKIDDALIMASRSIRRVEGDAPFHSSYAQTSLLIQKGLFQKALESAVALKEDMGSSYVEGQKGGSVLYAHNLLRIACLQKELKNKHGEKAAWEDLESLLGAKTALSELILSSFSQKNVNLVQYIAQRKASL